MYGEAGTLLLASRMKRLGDRLFSEITKAYRSLGLPFEPSWFPVFFLLDRDSVHSISSMAREMGVTDSAVSQLIRQLKERDLIGVMVDSEDKRAGTICLSESGKCLLKQVKPVWKAIESTIEEALGSGRHGPSLLFAMSEIEESISTNDLALQIKSRVDFCRLEETHVISTDLNAFEDWLSGIILSYTTKPHPSWPQPARLLFSNHKEPGETTQQYILLDNQHPIALLISSIKKIGKTTEHILFCAAEPQPSAVVEDFFLLHFAQSRSHAVRISVHINDKKFLYRLQKIGFGLSRFQESNSSEFLDLIFIPSKERSIQT